jgi:hypothetical protein
MRCACDSLVELSGDAADEYARVHLERVELDPVTWTVRYRCPDTGRVWRRDVLHGMQHAGGMPRLRQLGPDGEPIPAPGDDPTR